ncbi:zinc metallopeptidase [Anaerorhabdus sp.]|uniref:zinc metallopeptidase n=1 Tax=Anaerorhabdus sp. TaxID=1872524 RepID=UPI002FC992C9
MFFYIDWYYILLVTPAVIFSLWASSRVNSTYKRFSNQYSRKGITAEDACRKILDENGLTGVQIVHVQGHLTDHYDPRQNVIRLSDSVYGNTSTAAIGVACHEAGHAIQYAQNYAPIKFRAAIVNVTNIGSRLSFPLILLGIFLSSSGQIWINVAYFGVALFGLCVVFQLVTLPTEYNASSRAILALDQSGILDSDELEGSKKVLNAAALTYVAALSVTVMQFLRLLLIVGRRGNND